MSEMRFLSRLAMFTLKGSVFPGSATLVRRPVRLFGLAGLEDLGVGLVFPPLYLIGFHPQSFITQ